MQGRATLGSTSVTSGCHRVSCPPLVLEDLRSRLETAEVRCCEDRRRGRSRGACASTARRMTSVLVTDEFTTPPHLRTRGAIIDAYRELQQLGHFGQRGLELLFRPMREEVQRFPVLRPAAGWTEDSVWDCTQSFFTAKGPAVTAIAAGPSCECPRGDLSPLRWAIAHRYPAAGERSPWSSSLYAFLPLLGATPRPCLSRPAGTAGGGCALARGWQGFLRVPLLACVSNLAPV
jgi:hypothetical protein